MQKGGSYWQDVVSRNRTKACFDWCVHASLNMITWFYEFVWTEISPEMSPEHSTLPCFKHTCKQNSGEKVAEGLHTHSSLGAERAVTHLCSGNQSHAKECLFWHINTRLKLFVGSTPLSSL